jgi:hypothetical protein
LTVNSKAEDNFQSSATATAADAATVGVGGAFAWSRVANQATSFIGFNATADAGQTLVISDATVPNQVPTFNPSISFADTDTATGTGQVAEETADAKALAQRVSDAMTPMAAYIDSIMDSAEEIGTTFVHAGGGASGAAAIGGGVNFLNVDNLGTSGIAQGARVNQRLASLPATQDVKVHSTASVGTVNTVGQQSVLNNTGSGAVGVGGFFGGVWYDNEARAFIEDRATVSAGRDIDLHAGTRNDVVNAAQGGGLGADVGVDGAVGFVHLDSTSQAYVEDKALVTSGNDLVIDADNVTNAVNVAGGLAEGATVGVGASAALTDINNVTRAFIGDPLGPVGPLGTGGITGDVNVAGDLLIDAHSEEKVTSISISGAASTGSAPDAGAVQHFQELDFGFGISGDAAYNSVSSETKAVIRDVPVVDAAGQMTLAATGDSTLAAGSGAVAFGNHVGIGGSFAQNSLEKDTKAFTQDVAVDAGRCRSWPMPMTTWRRSPTAGRGRRAARRWPGQWRGV